MLSRQKILGGALALALCGATLAAAASEGQRHRIVGTWRISAQPVHCDTGVALPFPAFQAVMVIHAGGTTSEAAVPATPRTPAFGNWQRAGHREYAAVAIGLIGDANALPNGHVVVRRLIRLSDDGNSFLADTRAEITDASNNLLVRCTLGTGTRFE